MAVIRLGIIMHGVTGRMGTNQHLARSIKAIQDQGGVELCGGDRVMPDPILVGRDSNKLKALAKDRIDAWVHSAAVLDYVVSDPAEGKIASLQGNLSVGLSEGEKHVNELSKLLNGATRIGFKLECGVKLSDLITRALALLKREELDAVIANRLEDIEDSEKPRAHLVDSSGEHWSLDTSKDLVNAVRIIIEK